MKNKKEDYEIKMKKLREENKRLKKGISICLNRPLIKEIKASMERINKGQIVSEKEFFKNSPLIAQ